MSAQTPQELAGEAYSWFEKAERPDGQGSYIRLKDDRPEWLHELVREAHGGDFLPDDWRYETIREALGFISDNEADADGSHEFADGVDIYTGSLVEWLGSDAQRVGYCDEAQTEGLAGDDPSVVQLMQLGQYMERQEVYSLVWRELEERAEALQEA